MKVTQRQKTAEKRISEITNGINDVVDRICKEQGYSVTYAEVNSALIKVLQDNNQYELRQLYNTKKNEG